MRLLYLLLIFLIFTSTDRVFANVRNIAKEYKSSNLQKALKLSKQKNYKNIYTFLQSQKYIYNKEITFENIVNFLKKYPNWPQKNALIFAAEKKLSKNTSKKSIINWFDHNKPKTAKGHYYYYLASLGREKNTLRMNHLIKNAWIYGQMDKDEEKTFWQINKKQLNEEDHASKITELFWNKKYKEGKKYLSLVGANYKQVFKAWLEIEKNGNNAEKEFHKIKGSYRYNSGLLYSYLTLHKKEEPNQELITLLKKIPNDNEHNKEWWNLKNYYIRELIERKKYKDAYQIALKHNSNNSEDMSESEWLAGWVAFRFIKRPHEAIYHFKNIYKISRSAISLARGAYWTGRVYEHLKQKEIAYSWYKKAAKYGFTFYGQNAQYELRNKNIKLNNIPKITEQDRKNARNNIYGDILIFLALTKDTDLFKLYAKEAFFSAKTPGEVYIIFQKIRVYLNTSDTTKLAKLSKQAGLLIKDAAFPTPYKFNSPTNDKILGYSIMKQESVFDRKAVSSAQAIGLMQVIPSTAENVAKKHNITFRKRKLLSSPSYNMRIGILHLKDLLKEYDSKILTIATYNAGSVVNNWVKKMGDPRKMNLHNTIDWIESIPYLETRNYVQRVIENMQIYRVILSRDKTLRIKKDILS